MTRSLGQGLGGGQHAGGYGKAGRGKVAVVILGFVERRLQKKIMNFAVENVIVEDVAATLETWKVLRNIRESAYPGSAI